MAGHSKFKNIMYRKGAQDAKRSKLFAKLAKEITVAAKLGLPEPDKNPRLRAAISAAKAQSMPKDNIERAISRSQAGDSEDYEEIRYEGYAPGGIALIVDALTDNRNRTAADVRSTFSKSGGNLGETGSVNFMFDRVGLITYPAAVAGNDRVFEAALEAGAEDVESDDETHEIYCEFSNLHQVTSALEEQLGEAESAKPVWRPKERQIVDEENARKLMSLIEALEDNDDVQEIFGNFDIPDDVMERLNE